MNSRAVATRLAGGGATAAAGRVEEPDGVSTCTEAPTRRRSGSCVPNETSAPFASRAVRAVTVTVRGRGLSAGPSCQERTQPG